MRARFDGTVTIMQPLIAPLYDGRVGTRSAARCSPMSPDAAAVRNREGLLGRAAYRRGFRSLVAERGARWRRAGYGAAHEDSRRYTAMAIAEHPQQRESGGKSRSDLPPRPAIYDGRFANNGWLQELPKPITKLTWDNAAIFSPGTAQRAG